MIVRGTVKIKIAATKDVVRTINVYSKGLQFCVDVAWKRKIRNNVKLHPFVYKGLRGLGLPSQLAIACIKQACGMVKKAKSRPIIKSPSVRYNFPRSANLKEGVLVIRTLTKREEFKLNIPECYKEYFSWDVKESLLRMDRGKCFFLFTFSKEVNPVTPGLSKKVLGIDLGINKLAVTSDRRFFKIPEVKEVKNRFLYLRRKLQAKGTRSAKLLLMKLSGVETRFMTWANHNISKQIISSLSAGDVVVMENLKGIRKNLGRKVNRWLHSWSFSQLQNFITYKAERKGVTVVKVPAKGTSKGCSRCGSVSSRRHSGFFECGSCGFHLDADLNASYNIAQLYMRNLGKAVVNQPNVSSVDAEAPLLVN